MYAQHLRCISCQSIHELKMTYECTSCGGILDIEYEMEQDDLKNMDVTEYKQKLLPITDKNLITLGEGRTAFVKSNKLADRIGLKSLYFKNEFSNPTGSFKDRPVSIGISKAIELGYTKVIAASSGNGAGAVAAYAARANLQAIILVPESTPQEKILQAQFYGAQIIKVKGPYSRSFQIAHEAAVNYEMFNLTTTFINPYTLEGDKLIAYELYEQMQLRVPDYIYVPIGAGPLLVGVYKGYKEISKLRGLSNLPKMAGIQAEGCKPISEAYLNNTPYVSAEKNPSTIASGIGDGLNGYAKDGTYTLNTIIHSKGFSTHVNDEKIREAQRWLAVDEGLFVEPSAAASIASLEKSLEENYINEEDDIVVLLTGHGLKDMKQIKEVKRIPSIETISDLNQIIS